MLPGGAGPCGGRGALPFSGSGRPCSHVGVGCGSGEALEALWLEKCHVVRVADGTEHQLLVSSLTVTAFPIPVPLTPNVGSKGCLGLTYGSPEKFPAAADPSQHPQSV